MNRFSLLLLLVLARLTVFSQAQFPLNLHLQERFLLNPALAGANSESSASLGYRHQWIGIANSPATAYASLSKPVSRPWKLKPGYGFYVLNDRFGPFNRNILGGATSFTFSGEWGSVSGGLGANVADQGLNYDLIDLPIPGSLIDEDLLEVLDSRYAKTTFGSHAGIRLNHTGKNVNWQIGYSQPLFSSDLKNNPTVHLGFGFGKELLSELIEITHIANHYGLSSTDFSTKFKFKDIGWISPAYRWSYSNYIHSFAGKIGIQISPSMDLAYALDIPLSDMNGVRATSHEIALRILFEQKKKTTLDTGSTLQAFASLNGNKKDKKKRKSDDYALKTDVFPQLDNLKSGVKELSSKIEDLLASQKISDSILNELNAKNPKDTPLMQLIMVFFEYNDTSLSIYATHQLNQVFMALKKDPGLKVILTGYTDHLGSDEYNIELSGKRMKAVKDYLLENGIPGTQIIAGPAKGKADPISENAALNRRVEILFFR